ncbi:MAG: MaoC family dehydratase N-terminal domain-containing protein [Chloroflexota bacterium]|nr:MaoC family dehydratase N-terminal domain-containing protein [Chloroflexota bacterium]
MSIVNTVIGDSLSPLVKPPITQEQLQRYADAAGDHNPIHLDQEAAHRVGLQSVIAHGMLSMAFLGQFVTQQIKDIPGATLAQLKVRFVNMVRIDDTLTCLGIIKARHGDESGNEAVEIECWAQNQKGEKVTLGEAIVAVPLVQKIEVHP